VNRCKQASDATLAKRLAQAEILFDLHSAGMRTRAADCIRGRIMRVREELERRARAIDEARLRLVRKKGNV
jgi:hypothetical protein